MRTIDPAQWSKKLVKPALHVARPWQFRLNVMTTFERRMRQSFSDAMMEFLRNCSMKSVRCMVDKGNPKSVRRCYVVLLVSTLTCCLVVTSCKVAMLGSWPPLAVLTPSAQQAVREVDFPAVGLCSYNTISRAELDSYASYLYSLERNNTYSMENLKSNLMAFSGLITPAGEVAFDANFTKYLAEVARETNITKIIYKLSPKCESMLVRCSWESRRTVCRHLFALRVTDVGYCCVFNARYSSEDQNNPPYRASMVGQDSGLSVVVNENTDDFTAVRRTGEELELLLFDGSQYPLAHAGVLRSYPLRRNASVFVALRATVQRASDSLRYYSEAWRGCIMPSPEGGRDRLWAQCVAECRRSAVQALCRCSPHTKPGGDERVVCSLEHMACLDKYKEKLSFFYPGEVAHESLSQEQSDSVECLHCRPDCARRRYAAQLGTVPYGVAVRKSLYNKFADGLKLENATVIRIYFTSKRQTLYLVESNLRIYEVILFMSSQWVCVVGMTVITLMEFIYHCTIRWHHHYKRQWRRDRKMPKLMESWKEQKLYRQ